MNPLFNEKIWKESCLYLLQIKKTWAQAHIHTSKYYIYISYFDRIYISHVFIFLPAVESEQWEDCSLSSEADNDSEDVNLQLQLE